jgi:hypothetical protein
VSWKASLLGAIFVVAAGLAAGVAIGGKTTTHVLTVTVVQRVKTPSQQRQSTNTAAVSTSTTPATSATTSTAVTTPRPGVSKEQYLSSYLESQGGANTLNRDASGASLDGNPSQQELRGQTYQHAVAFDLTVSEQGATASYQIPTPGFTRMSSTAVGLKTTSSASAAYRLTVYKNDDSSPSSVVLYQTTFHGPSSVRKLDIATEGATDLLFVWTHKSSEPASEDTFIMADPVLTGGS